jgi:lipoprotein NlpI
VIGFRSRVSACRIRPARPAADPAVKAIDAAFTLAPKGNPFRAMLAWRQANGFNRRQDYDRAIAGYSTAIELSPGFSQYRADRGDARLNKLDYAQAIPDYTEAIRLNEGYSTAYNSRGYAYHTLGDLTHAIADYDAAIAIAPKFWEALAARGRARYSQGAYGEAVADLSASLPLTPSDSTAYTTLWLYLAHTHTDQPARDALNQDAAKLDKTAWPWPIVSAFLGDTTPDAVLAASRGDNNKECEDDFYFGATADPTTARDLLRKAADICPASFIETPAAKLELEKLSH